MRRARGTESPSVKPEEVRPLGLAWRSPRRGPKSQGRVSAAPGETLQPRLDGTLPGFFPPHATTRWRS